MPTMDVIIPTISGGISQQPQAIRHSNQTGDADNAFYSVVDGVSKRSPTRFVTVVDGLVAAADYRLHPIRRDADEEYLMVYGDSIIQIFDTDGNPATVTIDADAQTYLDLNDAAASDMALTTVADFTLLANKTVTVESTVTDDFTVGTHGLFHDYQDMISHVEELGSFGRLTEDNPEAPAGYYQYTYPGSLTFGSMELTEISVDAWGTPTGNWNNSGSNPMGFDIGFDHIDLATETLRWTEAELKLETGVNFPLPGPELAGYDFKSGDTIEIPAGGPADIVPGTYTVDSQPTATSIILTGSIASPVGDEIDVHVDMVRRNFQFITNFTDTTLANMHEIAFQMQQDLRALGATDILIEWDDNVPPRGHFSIGTPHRGDTAANIVLSPPTAPLSNLDLTDAGGNAKPFAAVTEEIDGIGTADFGATYGTETSPFLNPQDRWTRVAAPSDGGGRVNASTMPIKIVRTTVSPLVFNVDPAEWNDRLDGSDFTNPLPDLWTEGLTISAMGFYKNRLALAGGEIITFSQSGDVFNFYNEEFDNLGDADPITRSLADSDRVTLISSIIPYRSKIFIFTESDVQFQITSEDAFTPSDATITVSSRNANTAAVTPVTASDKMYVANDDGKSGIVDEYVYDDLLVSTEAINIAAHIPDLIPIDIKRTVASANHGTVAVLATDESRVYVHHGFFSEQTRRQSAWTKYTLASTDRISDIAIIDNHLYFLIEDDEGQYLITKMILSKEATITGMPAVVHLDRQIERTGLLLNTNTFFDIGDTAVTLTGTFLWNDVAKTLFQTGAFTDYVFRTSDYIYVTGGTAVTPAIYTVQTRNNANVIVLASSIVTDASDPADVTLDHISNKVDEPSLTNMVFGPDFSNAGTETVVSRAISDTFIRLTGDFTDGEVFIGRPYTFSVQLSEPFVRNQQGQAILDGIRKIRQLLVRHKDTMDYSVTLVPKDRASLTQDITFTSPDSGSEKFYILTDADDLDVTITNATANPCTITALEWIGEFSRKT